MNKDRLNEIEAYFYARRENGTRVPIDAATEYFMVRELTDFAFATLAAAPSSTERSDPPWLWGLLQEQPRPEVIAFAVAMERKLKANDHKGGWHSCGLPYLLRRIKQEVEELETLVCSTPRPPDQVCGEAADVGNFAMMIADVMEALPSVPSAIKTRGTDAA